MMWLVPNFALTAMIEASGWNARVPSTSTYSFGSGPGTGRVSRMFAAAWRTVIPAASAALASLATSMFALSP